MDASDVKREIERLDNLSTIPVVFSRILDATCDPESPPENLYRIISRDQALSEKVLRMANSPFFGHSGMVGDIKQAIMFLGYEHIRNIAIGISVVETFSNKSSVAWKKFWAHCYEVAFISAIIAETSTMVSPRMAFLAGLLHDTGRLFFFNLKGAEYSMECSHEDLLEYEHALFGCDHAMAGSWFAENAKLPIEQVLAIRYHHAPSEAHEYNDMVSIVSLAEALSMCYCPRTCDDGIWAEEHNALLLELSLDNDDLEDMQARMIEVRPEIDRFLEIL